MATASHSSTNRLIKPLFIRSFSTFAPKIQPNPFYKKTMLQRAVPRTGPVGPRPDDSVGLRTHGLRSQLFVEDVHKMLPFGYRYMWKNGYGPIERDVILWNSLFTKFAPGSWGKKVHCVVVKSGFEDDVVMGSAVLDMYAKCKNLDESLRFFHTMPFHNASITVYARSHRGFEGFELFIHLLRSGLSFDERSLSGAFSACAEARQVFDEMEVRDAVSWNSVIAACEQNKNDETLSLFVSMLRLRMEPDEFTFGSVIKSCARERALGHGKKVHGRVIKSELGKDSFLGSVLVMACVYAHHGLGREARGNSPEPRNFRGGPLSVWAH
ncbi:pentatricopeptide repeat-containing protein [Striga asiatica]|uniref:Pentatricopeptide repeat-containing protein n=1 Tax=Striga asiatica TaxID=4170 RepID=A0A5A7QJS5_STRAF|nr:pentatricopeptide repeat-containing protein [Striga asiatica]